MKKFTKREIIKVLCSEHNAENEKDNIEVALKFILRQLEVQINSVEEETLEKLRNSLRKLRSDRNGKWQNVRRISCKFEIKYGDWLNSEFQIPDLKSNLDIPVIMSNAKKGAGRPPLQFREMSERSKMQEVARISNENKNDSVRLISVCRYAAKKSKEKYLDIFPPYEKVLAEKQLCRPPVEDVLITEIEAKVLLQPLLIHTTERTFELQKDVLLLYLSEVDKSCTELETVYIFSYGFDGSSGHSRFNQGYQDTSQKASDDESLFATTLVPLRWLTSNNVVLWNNRSSQSASFARPISLMYMKKSAELILKMKNDLENQINELEAHEIILSGIKIQVHFSLCLTLIDGKVLNIITDTKSMQTCPICHATPKMFNNISNKGTSVFNRNPLSLQYGISPLHAWIRILELLLHISYRLEFKTWQVRSKEHKIKFAERKAKVQKMFWKELSLHVDKPKPGGSGTTNNENTARRAFDDPVKLAELLGLEKQLNMNFKTILIALSVQLPIDADLFDKLCFSTAEIYVKHYSWFPMAATAHKILFHGGDIIKHSAVPEGMLGEEASGSRNKDYKNYRENHSRKCSRLLILTDLFYRVMDTSDPIVNDFNFTTRIKNRKKLALPEEVRNLVSIKEIEKEETGEAEKEIDSFEPLEFYEQLKEIELSEEEEFE